MLAVVLKLEGRFECRTEQPEPDYVDAQATHKPQKSKKHFQLGSLSASTAENDKSTIRSPPAR